MTDSITAKPWTFHGNARGDFFVRHSQMSDITLTDMMSMMPIWAPAIICAALDEITKLRTAAEKPVPAGIQPIETAPRDGTYIDIWVKSNTMRQTPVRVADAQYSTRLSHPMNPSGKERYSGWYVYDRTSYLDKDEKVVGWTPIPEWTA